MKIFLNLDKYLIESDRIKSDKIVSNPPMLDEIDSISDNVNLNLSQDVKIPKDVLDSFMLKDQLNLDIWDGNHLNPKVRNHLTKIALDFYKDLDLPAEARIKDIIFTGSLANFNWSKFSDIDLHIVIDFNQFNAENKFVEDYFYAQKSIWNQEHDIKIHGFPVELYVQDINAKLVATAVYSVAKDKWLKKPTREAFKLDKKAIKDKADKFIYYLRDIRQDYNDHQYKSVVTKVTKLKDKIKQMRNAGLERGGEFSLENLTFKAIRRTPFMDLIDSFKAKSYDKMMSVDETASLVDESANPSFIKHKPTPQDLAFIIDNDFVGPFEQVKGLTKQILGTNLVKELGHGSQGSAFLTNRNTKIKYTFNKNEYEFAKNHIGVDNSVMADYYNAADLGEGIYVIEMEYLQQMPDEYKLKLSQTFHDMMHNKPIRHPELQQDVLDLVKGLGPHAGDIHLGNLGMKHGKVASFDPVAEGVIEEGEVLDNTKFKYKRTEDGNDILAYYNGDMIANLHMSLVQNGYDYFKDEFSEDEYNKLFPQDKFANIEWIQVKDKAYRGQGIAKELMKRAIAKASQQGYNKVYLNASPISINGGGLGLSDLTDFYKSLGFKEILDQGHNVQMLYSRAGSLEENREAMMLKKKKKDLERHLGKRLSDAEWNLYIQTGILPDKKEPLQLDPEKAAEINRRQALLQARYALLKAKGKI